MIDSRLLTVREAATYMSRTEKAIRHLYERGTLTPIRIDGRVQIDRNEIDSLIELARRVASLDAN
jgi:hypothetical protein